MSNRGSCGKVFRLPHCRSSMSYHELRVPFRSSEKLFLPGPAHRHFQGKMLSQRNENRPVDLNNVSLEADEVERDSELIFYCRHVVSELRQFYPDEYEMLEFLASKQIHDFNELASFPEYTKHLQAYGLLGKDNYESPCILIPVIGRYIGMELARKEGRQTLFKVVPFEKRSCWIEKRKRAIADDLRLLESIIVKTNSPLFFGTNSFPMADKFSSLTAVKTKEDFDIFINICNLCLVESIENYGISIGKKNYYWEEIKNTYPGLWFALQRIKLYRHESMHLMLTAKATDGFLTYLRQDLENKRPSEVPDCFFILQQCILDGLLTGIQIEINNLS